MYLEKLDIYIVIDYYDKTRVSSRIITNSQIIEFLELGEIDFELDSYNPIPLIWDYIDFDEEFVNNLTFH